ncbi:MAG: hypothetical protein M1822_009654 [Bathelium mastoideum]|nr:MAG: hypothetical protein M1822_009654 [Bathelium mastoideum]
MSKGKLNAALKLYNEMKKRAQFPDSHTYLLLLRGFAENPELPNSLGNALAIYHSMSADGARVLPSIIHSNAMLKVCIRADNMDALRGVYSQLPDSGPGAPDKLTFTTMLNALRLDRYNINTDLMSEEQLAKTRESAVIEGRQLWDNIRKRWMGGKILIDTNLVCAMGRLLLTGVRASDWDDVLSLVEQTMHIPRFVPRLGTKERQRSHAAPRLKAPYVAAGLKKDVQLENMGASGEDGYRARGEFDVIPADESNPFDSKSSSTAFAQPDSNTLSLILEACLKMASKKMADQYWDLLTQKFNILPDLDNIHMYLRCLRVYRSSAQTARLLREELTRDATIKPEAKTFRIAMSCCGRDTRNPNVMTNANQIMDLMEKQLQQYDARTAALYLGLSADTQDPEHQLYALERAKKYVVDIRSTFSYRGKARMHPQHQRAAHACLWSALRVYQNLLHGDVLTKKVRRQFQEERARLHAFLDRQADTHKASLDQEQSFDDQPTTREQAVG